MRKLFEDGEGSVPTNNGITQAKDVTAGKIDVFTGGYGKVNRKKKKEEDYVSDWVGAPFEFEKTIKETQAIVDEYEEVYDKIPPDVSISIRSNLEKIDRIRKKYDRVPYTYAWNRLYKSMEKRDINLIMMACNNIKEIIDMNS